jgi:predicted DNA-binding WGR domain protein
MIELKGKSFTVNFGKIGTSGQTQKKDFPDEAKAKKEYDKLIGEKVKKGYKETT